MGEDVDIQAGLYVVATPLGNVGDITVRALRVLKSVPSIACEDTRMTRDLLRHLDIAPPELYSVREHNERAAAEAVIHRIRLGQAVAYVSDAGTPAISDPGARLVAAVREAGFPIVPVPGASAVTTVLSAAGLEATAFTFLGFAPTAAGELAAFADAIAARVETSIFFESPHRVEKTLPVLAAALAPARRIVIGRELTKKFETISATTAGGMAEWMAHHAQRMRGEFVIVVEGAPEQKPITSLDAGALLKALLQELPPSKAAKLAAKLTGESRDALYALAERMKSP